MLNKVIEYTRKFATMRMLRNSELTESICKDKELNSYLVDLGIVDYIKQRELVSNILDTIGGNYDKESEYKAAVKDILLDCIANEKCRNYVFGLVGSYSYFAG